MRKKALFLIALVLVLVFPILTQQVFADENVRYVYPIIETNCDRINATAYRFYNGDTLNFTFTFTIQEPVFAYFQRNITHYHKLESIYGRGRFYSFVRFDGGKWVEGYGDLGFEGHGRTQGLVGAHFYEAGEHTVEIVYLFETYGDFEGFYVMDFLLEPRLTIEKINSTPIPMIPVLVGGISGAAIAFAISAVIWRKRKRAKKEENNVNP